MKRAIGTVYMWGFATVAGFYTALVLLELWNWFAAPALNVGPLSYWHMLGITMLIQVMFKRDTLGDQDRWERTVTMLYACIPADLKPDIDSKMKEANDNILLNAGIEIVSNSIGNTVALGIGWTIHTLLL